MTLKTTIKQFFCSHIMKLDKREYLHSIVIDYPDLGKSFHAFKVYAEYFHCLKCGKEDIIEKEVRVGKLEPSTDFS